MKLANYPGVRDRENIVKRFVTALRVYHEFDNINYYRTKVPSTKLIQFRTECIALDVGFQGRCSNMRQSLYMSSSEEGPILNYHPSILRLVQSEICQFHGRPK